MEEIQKVSSYVKQKNSGYVQNDGISARTTSPLESIQLLHDGVIAYEYKLYFVAMSWLRVFIENYLRSKLVEVTLPEDRDWSPFELFKQIDEVEKEIEESQYKDVNVDALKWKIKSAEWYSEMSWEEKQLIMKFTNIKWMFQHIVWWLVEYGKIEDTLWKDLISKYHTIRSAVQHGTYRRLYNEYKSILFEQNPILEESIAIIASSWFGTDHEQTFQWEINSMQAFIRKEQIQWIAKIACEDALLLVNQLLDLFETDY